MRKVTVVAIALGISTAVTVVGALVGQAQEKAKPGESVEVFDDPSFAAKEGVVTFKHLDHKATFGQEKLDCKPCHMTKPPLFSMKKKVPGEKRPVVTMDEMAQGKFCGGCHNGKTTINGKTAFDVKSKDNCGKCHKKAS